MLKALRNLQKTIDSEDSCTIIWIARAVLAFGYSILCHWNPYLETEAEEWPFPPKLWLWVGALRVKRCMMGSE